MKQLSIYCTIGALLLSSLIKAQVTDSTTTKKPMIIDGKKIRITIDTKDKSEETEDSKIIIDGDTMLIAEDKADNPDKKNIIVKEEKIIIKKKGAKKHNSKEEDGKRNPSNWFHADLGFNFLANNGTLDMPENYKDLELENGKGCNFNLKIYEQSISLLPKHLYLIYGVGIDWNNYRFKNNVDLLKDSIPLAYSINSNVEYKKNKLVSTYLTAPLMLKLRFRENKEGHAFQIAAGPQFGYLLNSHTKQKWNKDGDQKKKTNGDFNLTEFRIGYSVYLGYQGINFYARYFPVSAFKTNQGPDVNTVAVGMSIGSF